MADEPTSKPSDAPAARAIREAIERQRAGEQAQRQQAQQAMDERAATQLRSASIESQAAADRVAAQYKVVLIHIACCVLLILVVVLRYTLLKPWPELGGALISAVLFVWGQAGFKPSAPVLARVIATLEPNKLDRLLSLRPAAAGNSLHPRAPSEGDATP
jgi:Flp pilus assembly protein TadB